MHDTNESVVGVRKEFCQFSHGQGDHVLVDTVALCGF